LGGTSGEDKGARQRTSLHSHTGLLKKKIEGGTKGGKNEEGGGSFKLRRKASPGGRPWSEERLTVIFRLSLTKGWQRDVEYKGRNQKKGHLISCGKKCTQGGGKRGGVSQ